MIAIGVLAVSMASAATGCGTQTRGRLLAGGREVKSWVAELRNPNPKVRRQAVLKLGNVGDADPAAAEGLAEALHDSDALVRRDAIPAVLKLSKLSDAIVAQLGTMSRSDSDPGVRDYATRALAKLKR
jgi:HEAT repeat protein